MKTGTQLRFSSVLPERARESSREHRAYFHSTPTIGPSSPGVVSAAESVRFPTDNDQTCLSRYYEVQC